MKVMLLAHTKVDWNRPLEMLPLAEDHPRASDYVAEFAGRACYESWDRPNPRTATNGAYLQNIIARQHFSVLEHASATFYITDVSRTLTHELVRHRHLSFSQRSQRYVDESNNVAIIPDVVQTISDVELGNGQPFSSAVDEVQDIQRELYINCVQMLRDRGISNREARGAARFLLPAGAKTNIVVTGNHRAWREMIAKRWHAAAEAEIRKLAGLILIHLKALAPNTYQDFRVDRPIGMPPADA